MLAQNVQSPLAYTDVIGPGTGLSALVFHDGAIDCLPWGGHALPMKPSRWVPTWLIVGLACAPVLCFFTPLSPAIRDFMITGYAALLMALGLFEALHRASHEPDIKTAWWAFGAVFLLAFLSFGRQAVRDLLGLGISPHLPMIELSLWGLVALLLLQISMGFNRAQFRSRHPWISLLDGTVFTVALSQVLWLWVLQPIAHRAGLPGPERVGVLVVFGIASAALGITLHIMAKRESMGGPMGAFAAALVWIMAILPWWVKMNFLQEVRPAHPFRMVMLGGFLLLWLAVRAPWPAAPIKRSTRPWIMNLLPYVPAGFAFLGAFLHDLYFPAGHDRLNASLLASLAILVLLRQVVAFREIWAIKQSLEVKVEARTRELAETSRLLLQTQRMNFIATLGAGMAHDLNNLLGAALLNIELLESEPQNPEACGQRSRETLRSTLSKAGQLTRRLMTYGAEEPGHDSTVELAAHLRGLHPMLRALVPRSLNLDITCGAEALLVPCNPGLIDQVVVNLVVNARDATPPGGSISVKVETVSDASEEQDWVRLSVVDTGTGIPQENLTRIFEPFFSTKEAGKGTGLGLGSVKAVVEGLGGNIRVHSVMGQGSRFIVQLPKVCPHAS